MAGLFAEGHILFEDVPGVAKTMLSRAIAQSVGCSFKRIQCTPDLEPEHVIGDFILDPTTGRPDFRFGPLFAQMVLVDEINRASPRTQAAMLEAMGEGMVSMDRVSYKLEKPFMVMATQNPIEQEGTFRLPEAQMDRFLLRLSLGYPDAAQEKEMCRRAQQQHPIEILKPVTTAEEVLKCQRGVRDIRVSAEVCDYLVGLNRATREHPALRLGASPRGSLGLFRAAQALAGIQGNEAVTIAHIKSLAVPVLAHRLLVRRDAPERLSRRSRRHPGNCGEGGLTFYLPPPIWSFRKSTLAESSGVRNLSGFSMWTLICSVPLERSASGAISATWPE